MCNFIFDFGLINCFYFLLIIFFTSGGSGYYGGCSSTGIAVVSKTLVKLYYLICVLIFLWSLFFSLKVIKCLRPKTS